MNATFDAYASLPHLIAFLLDALYDSRNKVDCILHATQWDTVSVIFRRSPLTVVAFYMLKQQNNMKRPSRLTFD